MQVSFFKDAYSVANPAGHVAIQWVLECIRSGRWEKEVKAYRNGKRDKRLLPLITPSGTFKYRDKAGLMTHSGLVVLDVDNVPDIPNAKHWAGKMNCTLAVFTSSGGEGIKPLVWLDLPPEGVDIHHWHEQAVLQAAEAYEAVLGVSIDKSQKDVCRNCFLSSDPDIFINLFPEPAKINYTPPVPAGTAEALPAGAAPAPTLVAEWLFDFTANKERYTEGRRNHFIYLLACNCNRYGLSQNEAFQICHDVWQTGHDKNFSLSNLRSTVKSGYRNTAEHGTYSLPSHLFTEL